MRISLLKQLKSLVEGKNSGLFLRTFWKDISPTSGLMPLSFIQIHFFANIKHAFGNIPYVFGRAS